jgi:hypothetical protein
MPPHGWTNEEQEEFLRALLPEYMEINAGTRAYGDFWAKLGELWFQDFSESEALFPGKPESELTAEERSQVTQAMKKTLNVGLFIPWAHAARLACSNYIPSA